MELDGTFCDQYALQVIANVMERDILIIPSNAESVQNVVQQIHICEDAMRCRLKVQEKTVHLPKTLSRKMLWLM